MHQVETILMAVAILRRLEVDKYKRRTLHLWADRLETAVVDNDLEEVARIKRNLQTTGDCAVNPDVRLMMHGVACLLMSDA